MGWNRLQRIGLNFRHVCHLALSDRIGEQHPITSGHSAFRGVLRAREWKIRPGRIGFLLVKA